jgi:hypothetical protein
MLLLDGIAEHRKAGDKEALADKLRDLAPVVQHQQDYRRAASVWKESLSLHRELGHGPRAVDCLEGLAGLAGLTGQQERSARLFAAADALREVFGPSRSRTIPLDSDRLQTITRVKLGEVAFTAAWTAGRTLSLEQAIAEALAIEISPAEEG